MNEYRITKHVRERFLERSEKKYRHLHKCNGCDQCTHLIYEIQERITRERRAIDQEIIRRISVASECRSYLNDTNFMEYFYKRYGFDKNFRFFADNDNLFVVIVDNGVWVVITCMNTKTHTIGQAVRQKFGRKSVTVC